MRRLTKAKIRILSKESLPKIASEDDEMVQLRFQETLIFRRMVLCSLVVAVLVGLWKLFFGTNCHFWRKIRGLDNSLQVTYLQERTKLDLSVASNSSSGDTISPS
ncbi:uncharacterized protein LOC129313386 isoform X3 [Prosopis cineraria]|uniref:uncharacterized protein LOC129313386 isoform X3 n=1 Tax=Prosopis cineraria TaxID=364024 RepID=UPI0024104E42|nr:uncharacterized protein LOC129313386 isoform X3 [Prosopis cineraria]